MYNELYEYYGNKEGGWNKKSFLNESDGFRLLVGMSSGGINLSKKEKKRLTRSQKILIAGLVITLLTIHMIDSLYYAGVMNLATVSNLTVAMIVFLLFNHGSRNPVVTALLAGVTTAFCMAMIVPDYTYSQAYDRMQQEQPGQMIEDEVKTVPVTGSGFDVFGSKRFYRFAIEQEGGRREYMLNPDSGEVIQIVQR